MTNSIPIFPHKKEFTSEDEQIQIEKQKIINYKEILKSRWILLKSVDGLKIDDDPEKSCYGYNQWTAYWDMKEDIKNLQNELNNSQNQDVKNKKSEELQRKISNFEVYCYSIFFHDFFDHLFNGQNQLTNLSDRSDDVAENYLLDDTSFYTLDNNSQSRGLEYVINEINLDRLNSYDKFNLEIINLLPQSDKEKLLSLLKKAKDEKWKNDDKFKLLVELEKNDYQQIFHEMARIVTRGQVLRGLISLAYYPYNKQMLKFLRNGLPIENDPTLKSLWTEATKKIAKLNQNFEEVPKSFDSYEIYFSTSHKAYVKYTEPGKGYLKIKNIRTDLYNEIKKVMDDTLMEKLAKEMWQEKNEGN